MCWNQLWSQSFYPWCLHGLLTSCSQRQENASLFILHQACTRVHVLTHTGLENNRQRITSEVNAFCSEPNIIRNCNKGLKNLEYFSCCALYYYFINYLIVLALLGTLYKVTFWPLLFYLTMDMNVQHSWLSYYIIRYHKIYSCQDYI